MKTIQLFLIVFLLPLMLQGQTIVTVAGIPGSLSSGRTGDGGPATNANVGFPGGIAIDANGNTYASNGFYIRKISPDGIISTYAGNGTAFPSFDSGEGGSATSVSVSGPNDGTLFCNRKNELFFPASYSIRKISATGIVTTVVGTRYRGTPTGAGRPATATTMFGPLDIFIDTSGRLYYLDSGYYVRYVDSAGIVRTFAGNGTNSDTTTGVPATASSVYASAMTGDLEGNIYVGGVVGTFCGIRRVDKHGIITNYAGSSLYGHSGDGGPATAASVDALIAGMACDAHGNLYFSESAFNTIRKVNRAGIITTIAGIADSGGYRGNAVPATTAKLKRPMQVKVAPNGDIYFADYGNNIVRRLIMPPTGVAQPYVPLATVTAYPNPAVHGQVTLQCSYPEATPMAITISAADGRYTQQSNGTTNTPLQLQLPANGVYYITVRLKDQSITQTVVAQ